MRPGEGRLHIAHSARGWSIVDEAFQYPLKILVPRRRTHGAIGPVALAYLLTYGGGLVGGDHIAVDMAFSRVAVCLLTQGSTKVFRDRLHVAAALAQAGVQGTPALPLKDAAPSSASNSAFSGKPSEIPRVAPSVTLQEFTIRIEDGALVALLPAPVTCFADASYIQKQHFALDSHSSLLLVDWYTSGRVHTDEAARGVRTLDSVRARAGAGARTAPESWRFRRYESHNCVSIDGRLVANDVTQLAGNYAWRMGPYACYATVVLVGPALANARRVVLEASRHMRLLPAQSPPVLWGASDLGPLTVVRAAGERTEMAKQWLNEMLSACGVRDLLGEDAWQAQWS